MGATGRLPGPYPGRMGKALIAVGTFLSICMLLFAGSVYFTRDEDGVAVDALLAERLSKAFVEAQQNGDPLDLRRLTPFDWDQVLIYPIGTPRSEVSRVLGFEFNGELSYTAESSEVFVFTNRGAFVKFADYRGRGRFEGLRRPTAYLTAGDAVFDVEDGVATLE
jgi:hypothetical protein